MSTESVVHRYVEAVNGKDASGWARLFAEDAVLHDPFFPEPVKGRSALQAMLEGVLRAFPDMRWQQVGAAISGGDRVAFVVSVEGTNEGPLAMPGGEVPATGRPMSYEAAVLLTLGSADLITEERSYFDATGVAAQLGMTG